MANKNKKSESLVSRFTRRRSWVQTAFLLVWLSPWLRLHSVCGPVFHCYSCPLATFACPIGVLANFSAIHVFPFVAVGTLVIFGVLLGSFVCGWVCPFGLLQDMIGRIPTPKFELPVWMGNLRYVVLAVFVLAIPFWYGEEHPLFFCSLCPAGALEAALPNGSWPNTAKTTITALVLVAMFFKRRPWCTVFCPLGAIYGLLNRVSVFFVQFHPELCTDCDLCRGRCPCGGIAERRAGEHRCVRCLACVQCRALTVDSVFQRAEKQEDVG